MRPGLLTNAPSFSRLKFIPLLILLLVLIQSCGKPVDNSKFIPEDASFVVCFNLKNFSTKAPNWLNLLNTDLPLFNISRSDQLGKNLQNAGIDLNSTAYLFSNVYHQDDGDVYYALSLRLEDESKFDKFLRNYPKLYLNIKSYSGLRYALLDKQTIVGWLNSVALLITKVKETDEKALREQLSRFRDLPESKSLKKVKDSQFQMLRLSEYDVASWINLRDFDWFIKQKLRKFPLPITIDLEKNYLTSTSMFEEGQLQTQVKLHNLNGSLQNYKEIFKANISNDLSQKVATESPMGVLGMGLKMGGIKDVFNSIGGSIFTGQTRFYTGETPNKIIDMLSGDVVAVLQDVDIQADEEAAYKYLIGLGIADTSTLNSILDKFTQDQVLIAQDSLYYYPQSNLYVLHNNQQLFITSSDSLKNNLLNADDTNPVLPAYRSDPESFLATFADVRQESRVKLPMSLFYDDYFTAGLARSIETPIESLELHIKSFKDSIFESNIDFYFKDKSQNALISVVEAMQELQMPPKTSN